MKSAPTLGLLPSEITQVQRSMFDLVYEGAIRLMTGPDGMSAETAVQHAVKAYKATTDWFTKHDEE